MSRLYHILFDPKFLFILVFVISVIFFYAIEILLHNLQYGQVVREDGPATHQKKSGTPTMAGLVFIVVFLIVELFLLILKDYVNGTKALKINIFIIIF
ncbi:MAG: hypothetical protein II411_05570, partial [Lachnospiraceae bacterium]|nr:hypothetical protein [Lachnospiraceae bacterium]